MKRLLGFESWLVGGALIAIAAQPAQATATVITGVRVVPTDQGAQIVLRTQAGDTPQVFAVNDGNSLRADIVRTALRLPEGGTFTQQDPAPGIESISLVPLDSNSVRLTVNGNNRIPMGTIAESESGGIVINVEAAAPGTTAAQPSSPLPANIPTVPGPQQPAPQVAQAEPAPEPAAPAQSDRQPDVLVPNPEVIIDGVPVPAPQAQQAPPFLPRAVPPPVGDIAVSETRPGFGAIDLGTAERVPRLVLRNAPSREVLSLLARAAGLNLVFVDQESEDGASEGPPITLDIQNESVQEVFNSVLRVTGLDANRVGRTIYVGTRLPTSAQNVSVRTLRLNQVDAGVASNFLVGLGAESAISRERQVTTVDAVAVSEGAPPVTQTQTTTETRVETQRVEFQDSQPIFRGLQVIAEERTNSVTLVGSPQLIELATEQLVRLDLRRRQVAINVKVIDINLNALDAFGTSFSFAVGDVSSVNTGGLGVINFGNRTPSVSSRVTTPGTVPIIPSALLGGGIPFVPEQLLSQIFGTVREGNAKILTDPTLIVQEGQNATVQLTEQVVTNVEIQRQVSEGETTTTIRVETEPAGLILQVNVDRIDDNGFVTLSVAPSISAPSDTFGIPGDFPAEITLLAERQLSSGQVRVRDGQTLLLSGIIQETDRSEVTKVPILGDIPILGALFRSNINTNERRELIVMLTPQVLDDSDASVFGYSYTPSEDVQDLINRSRRGTP